MDKRNNNGGKREGSGAKEKKPDEKRVQIVFGVKKKHESKAKKLINPIIKKINKD